MKNSVRLALWALACLIFGSVSVQAQNITTVIGGGPNASPATTSSIGAPAAVRFDTLGNAYFLDNNFGRVIKQDHTTQLLSVYAGDGTVGFFGDGGPATAAKFNGPSGMCIDPSNNLYIADSDNAVIRKITFATGVITTVVGVQNSTDMIFGGDGGPALAANLHFPDGCSFDTAGNMYIADRGNNEIRVVYAGGTKPAGMGAITMVTGNIYKFAGGTDGAPPNPPSLNGGFSVDGTQAQIAALYGPWDVFVDTSVTPNNVYYTEIGNHYDAQGNPILTAPINNNIVRVIQGDGSIHTVAGKQGVFGADNGGPAVGSALNQPKGLSVDTSGNVYFADKFNQVIRKVTKTTGNISIFAGQFNHHGRLGDNGPANSGAASLTLPAGTLLDASGDLYIADQTSFAIRFVPAVTGGGKTAGNIYTVAGDAKLSYGGDGGPALSGEVNTPGGLAVDGSGNIIIADSGSDLVRKVNATTPFNLSTLAGSPEAAGFINPDTEWPAGVLNIALGVAVDGSGNIYVADTQNCLVRKITGSTVKTIAGIEPPILSTDDPDLNVPKCGFGASGTLATSTNLGFVNSVAVDSNGNVFFSDNTNSVIWEVPAVTVGTLKAGNAYIVAGSTTAGFAGEGGPANQAELSGPTGIFIDVFNNLFIADAGNHRIREVPSTTAGTMTAGSIYTIAGNGTTGNTGDGGAATAAKIATPFAIVADHAGNVFFSDTTNQTVREVTASTGNISTVAGNGTAGFSGDGAAATTAELNVPQGLALRPTATPNTTSDLLISDSVNNRVRSVAAIGSNVGIPAISLSPNPLTFPSQTVGTPSAASVITLTSSGGAPVTVTGFTKAGTNAADYTETDNCVATLAAGATCTINVVFNPAAAGASTATLTVATNPASASQTITLNGTGGSPVLSLTLKDTDSSSTQTVTAGATATYNLSLTGNQSVTATITCTGAPTDATCTPAPASVAVTAAAAGTFKVSITTTARGEMLPFNQPSMKMQPPSFMQIAPMASLALLFVIAMMLGWMQNQPGRMRLARVALSLCLILMPIAAATVLVGCGGGSSTPPPPPPATGTPAGTYAITVTATSGSTTSKPLALTLVVN